jgi:hypothetical protein
LKDEETIDWCKRISKLSLDKGRSSRKVMEACKREDLGCMWREEKKRKEREAMGERLFF